MKKIRLFIHKYRFIIPIIIIFLILSFIYMYKDTSFKIYNYLLDKVLVIEDMVTPKVNVNYTNIIRSIDNEKDKEIDELYNLLELNKTSEFDIVNASIISRNVNTYMSNIVIDKGKNDGIDIGYAVVTDKGLVGYINKVFTNYSHVSLLNNDNINKKISVSIHNGENIYNGSISGYDSNKNEIIVTSIRSNSKIEKNNLVITNGYGKIIPAGIPVGTVIDVSIDNDTSSKVVRIKPNANMDNIKYVGVIK